MITVIANQQKYDCLQLLKKIEALLTRFKTPFQVIQNYPFDKKDVLAIRSAMKWIILGGDGTILSAFAHFSTPPQGSVLAVNFGTLGYMAGIAEQKALAVIENYLLWKATSRHTRKNKTKSNASPPRPIIFKEEKRYILFTESGFNHKPPTKDYYALNEMTVRATQTLSPIRIEVKINQVSIIKVLGDGIIIATPTGSTAYSLSAGGPILSPEIEALVLTFISPHSLTVKPIVVARGDIIELTVLNDAMLGIDGAIKETIIPGQSIRCKLETKPLTFIKPTEHTAYQSLKQKLHWGE